MSIAEIKKSLANTSDPVLRRCLRAELSVAVSAASRAHRADQDDRFMAAIAGNSKPWLATHN